MEFLSSLSRKCHLPDGKARRELAAVLVFLAAILAVPTLMALMKMGGIW